MDKLRAVVAGVRRHVARSRPTLWLRRTLTPSKGGGETQQGQGLAEYALILAGIAIVAIVSLGFLGASLTGLLQAPINAGFAEVLSRIGI